MTVAAEDRQQVAALMAGGPPPAGDSQAALRWKLFTASPWHEYPSEVQLADDLRRVTAVAAPDLVIATGDLTNVGTLAQLRSYRAATESVPRPVFSVFGGHDGNEERIEVEAGCTYTRRYETVLGPAYYSFDWGGRHFIVYATEDGFFSAADQQRKERWLWADLAAQPPRTRNRAGAAHAAAGSDARPPEPLRAATRAARSRAHQQGLVLRTDRRAGDADALFRRH